GGFAHCTGPQHGGRAAASTRHPGDDCVDAELLEALGKRGERRLLVAAVRAAELAPAHEAHAGEALAHALLEQVAYEIALEELIPELRNGLACERVEARGEGALLHLPRRAGPENFVVAVVGGHGRAVLSLTICGAARGLHDDGWPYSRRPGTPSLPRYGAEQRLRTQKTCCRRGGNERRPFSSARRRQGPEGRSMPTRDRHIASSAPRAPVDARRAGR